MLHVPHRHGTSGATRAERSHRSRPTPSCPPAAPRTRWVLLPHSVEVSSSCEGWQASAQHWYANGDAAVTVALLGYMHGLYTGSVAWNRQLELPGEQRLLLSLLGSGRRHLISLGASDTRPVQCKVRRFLLALRLMTRRARGKLPVAASTSHGLAPVVTIVRLVDSASLAYAQA